jgi:hypothetical protein
VSLRDQKESGHFVEVPPRGTANAGPFSDVRTGRTSFRRKSMSTALCWSTVDPSPPFGPIEYRRVIFQYRCRYPVRNLILLGTGDRRHILQSYAGNSKTVIAADRTTLINDDKM